MNRPLLWSELVAASEDARNALAAWTVHPGDPAKRLAAITAFRAYTERLAPVIGRVATFRYEAAFESLEITTDRHLGLLAAFAARRAPLDESDQALLDAMQDARTTARAEFDTVGLEIDQALKDVAGRDTPSQR